MSQNDARPVVEVRVDGPCLGAKVVQAIITVAVWWLSIVVMYLTLMMLGKLGAFP